MKTTEDIVLGLRVVVLNKLGGNSVFGKNFGVVTFQKKSSVVSENLGFDED